MNATTNKPSVGRIVHYSGDPEAGCMAAIITAVDNESVDAVSLQVFYPGVASSLGAYVAVPYQAEGESMHTWHWPERV
jgi:hypothetical protein